MIDACTLLIGKSFTGKTARMVWELNTEPRVVLVDPKCAQLVKLKGYAHLWPVFDFESSKVLGRPVWTNSTGAEVAKFFRKRLDSAFRVVIHCRNAHREQLELICNLLLAVKNLALAVDECALLMPTGPPNALPRNVTAVVVSGSHEYIKFIGTSQRTLFHNMVRANASKILWYRITLKDDLAVASNYCGIPFRDETLVGKIKVLKAR